MGNQTYPAKSDRVAANQSSDQQCCTRCGHDGLKNLSAVFELRAGEYKLSELASRIAVCARNIFSGVDFSIVYRDIGTGAFQLKDCTGERLNAELVLNTAREQMTQLCLGHGRSGDVTEEWIAVGSDDNAEDYSVMVFHLGTTRKYDLLVTGFTSDNRPFDSCEKEMLTVFSAGARATFEDALLIRDVKKANRLLKESSDQLATAETLAALTDMTSGMAHDFNNVIGAVIGRVQLMKLKVTDEKLIKDLNKIEKMLLEGAGTVRSIQEFTTSTKYKKTRTVNLNQLITDYFSRTDHSWRKQAAAKNVQIEFKPAVRDALVDGSPPDLATVLDKLVENAVEYSHDNMPVELILEQTRKDYRLRVVNRGTLISQEVGKKVFYPFFTTKDRRGAGMGLAIVHGIVGRHSGKISVNSNAESGTVFEIELPKADATREDSEVTHRRKKVRDLRILVVDDDEQIREVLTDMLAINGHTITSCCDGFSALDAFRKADFDIVITDLGMAGMSGLDLAGLIHQEKPEIPVALITGWGSQLNPDEMALKGVKAVVAKPFHLEEIHSLVEKLIANNK
ncbi:MAG: response regulator [Candidatus Zixiibacteriota bacterium]|nr:MAG: response regulator [candidate division Zixibacteria bacterium]